MMFTVSLAVKVIFNTTQIKLCVGLIIILILCIFLLNLIISKQEEEITANLCLLGSFYPCYMHEIVIIYRYMGECYRIVGECYSYVGECYRYVGECFPEQFGPIYKI